MILINLRKTFDTINHGILLIKCPYFSSRSFRVNIKNKYYSIAKLGWEVLQGCILGPLLFLLYVNDMNQVVDRDFLFLHPDGSCLDYQHKDVKEFE